MGMGSFRAIVCKTVRLMLSDRSVCLSVCLYCPVCLFDCPVCNVGVCGQTVGRNKVKLGMPVGLGPGHIVLDAEPAPPPPKGHSTPPNFLPMSVVTKRLDELRRHLARR